MKQAFLSLILFLSVVTGMSQALNQVKIFSDNKKSFVEYAMNHPLHSWTGVSTDFISVILTNDQKTEISQVAVSCKISSFDSKNANRDSHVMEVTDAIKYPNVTFASNSVSLSQNHKSNVAGKLTFHGVSKDIFFETEQKQVGDSLEVTGGFSINMTDFDIERPSLMGIATDDEIKIDFKLVF